MIRGSLPPAFSIFSDIKQNAIDPSDMRAQTPALDKLEVMFAGP